MKFKLYEKIRNSIILAVKNNDAIFLGDYGYLEGEHHIDDELGVIYRVGLDNPLHFRKGDQWIKQSN